MQLASLLSIKTGGCPEDCGYCPQSAHHAKETGLAKEALMDVDEVLAAKLAREAGASRFCMGAAWREVRDGDDFDAVVDMVRGVGALGMEACVTLGMLQDHQAKRLAEAGLTAYNHNLDTSPEFYGEIISTRDYYDRLETLKHVREAGITLLRRHHRHGRKQSRPRLAAAGAGDHEPASRKRAGQRARRGQGHAARRSRRSIRFELVRMVAAARILMPQARVRLSAGRANSVARRRLCVSWPAPIRSSTARNC